MRQNWLALLVVFSLSPFLVQCATRQDVQTLELRLRNLDNRLVNMDQGVKFLEVKTGESADKFSVERVQKQLASQSLNIDRLKTDLLQAKGQLDEISRQYQVVQEENAMIRAQLSGSVVDLSGKMEAITLQLDKTATGLDEIRATRLREETERVIREAKAAEEAAVRAKEEARRKEKSTGLRELEPQQVKKSMAASDKPVVDKTKLKASAPVDSNFAEAKSLFQAKKFKDAHRFFTRFLEKKPKGSQAATAHFYLGECLFNTSEFELAILEYQRVIDEFDRSDEAPAALLRQGLAFEKLKDAGTAKMVYYKLLDEYPASAKASEAKKRLDALN